MKIEMSYAHGGRAIFFVQMMAMLGEKASGIIATHGEIKSTDGIADSDTAIVALVFETGEVQNLDLMKIDGCWKITISST
jgi:cephalosporin hydroxylase